MFYCVFVGSGGEGGGRRGESGMIHENNEHGKKTF